MAAWQFSFHLIPRSSLRGRTGSLPMRLDADVWGSEERTGWSPHELTPDYGNNLDRVLPRMEGHWCKGTEAWGTYEEDLVEVTHQRGLDVHVRLDVRHINPELLDAILSIAAASDCCLVTEDLMVIEPERELVAREIEQSSAAWFVTDPSAFLEAFGGMPRLS